jgi:hypothetical protein
MATSSLPAPRTGRFFSLDAFEASVQSDPEILGLLYTGSLGSGETDPYSDLDLDVWITAEAWRRVDTKLRNVLATLGAIQFVYDRGPAFATAFVGPDWQRVDLHLHGPSAAQTFADYAHGRVVKDLRGTLRLMVESAPHNPITPSWDAARAELEESIDSIMYATLHNARGEHWSAASEISGRVSSLYALLASLRGRASHGLRYVTNTLSQEEQEMLARAWPGRFERDEVRRAATDLWSWTRYVWREVERTLGRSLEIEFDERAMLQAIDNVYSIPTVS